MHCSHNEVVPRLVQFRVVLGGLLVLDIMVVPITGWLVRGHRATLAYF